MGAVLGHYRTGRFFEVRSTDLGLPWRRKAKFIREDTALDGFYIIRTSVGPELLSAEEGVKVYKELSHGETAFRSEHSRPGSQGQVWPVRMGCGLEPTSLVDPKHPRPTPTGCRRPQIAPGCPTSTPSPHGRFDGTFHFLGGQVEVP